MHPTEETVAQMAAVAEQEKAKRAAKVKAAKEKAGPAKTKSTTNFIIPPPLHQAGHARGGYAGRKFGPLQVSRNAEFAAEVAPRPPAGPNLSVTFNPGT